MDLKELLKKKKATTKDYFFKDDSEKQDYDEKYKTQQNFDVKKHLKDVSQVNDRGEKIDGDLRVGNFVSPNQRSQRPGDHTPKSHYSQAYLEDDEEFNKSGLSNRSRSNSRSRKSSKTLGKDSKKLAFLMGANDTLGLKGEFDKLGDF